MDFVLEELRIMVGAVRSQDNSIRHLNFTAPEEDPHSTGCLPAEDPVVALASGSQRT